MLLNALGTRVVIGLAIAAALGLADLVGVFAPPPDIGQAPPWAATLSTAVAGGLTLVAAGVVVWAAGREHRRRAGRVAVWIVVATRVASVVVAVPTSFLTGLTVPLVAWAVVTLAITVLAVVLLLTGIIEDPA